MCIKRLLILLLLVSCESLFAEEFVPNLKQGNIFLATGSNYYVHETKTYEREDIKDSSEFNVRLEYFIQDGVSVGGLTSINTTPYYEFGGSASFFFLIMERSAVYIQPEFITERWEKYETTTFEMATRVGYNYFLIPSVSIGPSCRFAYRFKRGDIKSLESRQIELMLAIFI